MSDANEAYELDEEFQPYFEDVELTPEQIEEIRRRQPTPVTPWSPYERGATDEPLVNIPAEIWNKLGDAKVKFWCCSKDQEHRRENDYKPRPMVEWNGPTATCLICGETNA